MTVHQVLQTAAQQIARRDAELLLQHTLHCERVALLAHPELLLTPEQLAAFTALVARRAAHWPVQYLTGQQEFYGLTLHLTPDVLIPRPETELLVEAVLAWAAAEPSGAASAPLRIVDVGTGSGAIAVALAHALPAASVDALDIASAVQPVVERNAQTFGLQERVRFRLADLLAPLDGAGYAKGSVDVIVSNPPYVPLADAPGLQSEVRDFEPHLALFGGEDGLAVYERLIPQAWPLLRRGGLLALEFGFGQQPALARLLAAWEGVQFLNDYAGIARLVLARRP